MKTNKSFSSRLKVTRQGKILARKPGQNAFNAKESGETTLAKKRLITFPLKKQDSRRFLPKSGA